jgi:hypothetical protein
MRTLFFLKICIITALIELVFPMHSYAYLDPGAGSYMLQVMAAFLFGGLYFIKTFWQQLKAKVSSLFGSKENNDPEEKNNDPEEHDDSENT